MTRRSVTILVVGLTAVGGAGLYRAAGDLSRPVPAHVGPPPAELQADAVTFPSESGSVRTPSGVMLRTERIA